MKVKLSDAFDLQMGKTPPRNDRECWGDGHKWISISDIGNAGKYIDTTKEEITDIGVSKSGIKVVPKGTVIMSFKLSIGKTAITAEDMYTNEAIMAFINKGKYEIDTDYLYHMCKGIDWFEGTNKAVLGLTLNKATMSEKEIEIPSMAEQLNVVAVLDKMDELIALRKEQLAKLDRLVKSRFIELFGDPVYNNNGLPTKKLRELGSLDRGRSQHRPRNDPKLLNGPYPLIQTGEVASAGLYITEYKNTYSELGLQQSKMWKAGTLCITIAANIAQTAILTFDACFPDSVVGFVPGDAVSAIYMHYWFGFFQKILEEQAPQVAQKNINLKILSDLDVMVPTKEQQEQFAAFVEQTDKSKLKIQQSLEKLELLKKSLMQEYFG